MDSEHYFKPTLSQTNQTSQSTPIHHGVMEKFNSHWSLLLDLGDLLNALHQGLVGGIDLPQHGKGGQAEDADGACRWQRMAATFQLRDKSDKKPGDIAGKSLVFVSGSTSHQPPDSSKSSHRADRAATSRSPWVMDRSRGASHASPQMGHQTEQRDFCGK